MDLAKGQRMNWAEGSFYVSLACAVGLQALPAAAKSQWDLALVVLAVGAGWGGAHWLARRWLSPVAFVILVGCAVAGLWRNVPAAWLVAGVAAALAALDLDGFATRLARYEPRPDQTQLVKNHLGRLLGVMGPGVILGEAALMLRLTLGLGVVAVVGLLVFAILLLGMRLLGRDSERPAKKNDV
jgi:hypothetical protein